MTLDELFKTCWADHWSKKRYQNSGWAAKVRSLYHKHIQPHFGSKRINKILRPNIRRWHDSFTDDVYSGNRSLSVLKSLFTHAEQYEILPPTHPNPTSSIRMHSEVQRERYATPTELKRLMAYLNNSPQQNHSRFIRLLLMTGSRPQALAKIGQSAINRLEDGTGIAVFKGKCHEDKVTFSREAMTLVDRGGLSISYRSAYRYWKQIQRDIPELADLWMRDLRRTFATIGLSNGVPLDHIGRVLNHKDPKITLRYAKLMDSARIDAVDAVARALKKVVGE